MLNLLVMPKSLSKNMYFCAIQTNYIYPKMGNLTANKKRNISKTNTTSKKFVVTHRAKTLTVDDIKANRSNAYDFVIL